jgi:DNA-binding NtrC family response regulator
MTVRPEVLAFGCRENDIAMLSDAFDRIEPDLRVMTDAQELARQAVTHRPLAIVLGFGKTSVSQLSIIPVIHAVRSDLPVIVIAESASLHLERAARQERIFYYLVHPIERSEVEVVLQDLLRSAKD